MNLHSVGAALVFAIACVRRHDKELLDIIDLDIPTPTSDSAQLSLVLEAPLCVNNLEDAFRWPFSLLRQYFASSALSCKIDLLNTLQRTAKLMQCDTITTAFSGIDAPCAALQELRWALSRALGYEIPAVPNLAAIEWDEDARATLLHDNMDAPRCVFGDILFLCTFSQSNAAEEHQTQDGGAT